jgi:hypothetical protein
MTASDDHGFVIDKAEVVQQVAAGGSAPHVSFENIRNGMAHRHRRHHRRGRRRLSTVDGLSSAVSSN